MWLLQLSLCRIVLLYRYSIRIDGCGRADPVTAVRKCQAPLHQPRLRSLTVRCFTFTPGAMLHNYEVSYRYLKCVLLLLERVNLEDGCYWHRDPSSYYVEIQ